MAILTEIQVAEGFVVLGRHWAEEIGPAFARMGCVVSIHDKLEAGGGHCLIARRIADAALPTVLS